MLRNHFKIAWRNLWKHKLFSFINIVGLASGLTVCLLAIAHIKGAFDYDAFHPNRDRIYRVLTDVVSRQNDLTALATSPMPLAGVLERDYAFVEASARVTRTYGEITGNSRRLNLLAFAVDPHFFRVFGYPLAQGQPATEPGTAVVTRQTAEKFFGTENPVGKVLQQEGMLPATITGVLADAPNKSHLKFDVLFSLATGRTGSLPGAFQDWRDYQTGYTYVLLKPGFGPDNLANVLPALAQRVTKGIRFRQDKGYSFRLQALNRLSPGRETLRNATYEPDIAGLLVDMGVGLLTLLMAGFNYINLTLARSLSRAREVGIRKVAGAVRWQLVGQFMAESVVLSLLALVLAFGMLELVKPMAFVQQWLIGGVQWSASLWISFVVFSIVAGLLAGLVPARILSGFQPAQVLRSQTGLRVIKGISLRKSLIVIQFVVSLVAMIALVTMVRQMDYMATGDYGFRRERVLTIPLNDVPAARLSARISQLAGVERVAATSELFGSFGNSAKVKRSRYAPDSSHVFDWAVDEQFVPAMNLSLLAGRNLPPAASASGRLVLINEELVRAFRLGSPQAAVGQSLWLNDSLEVTVVGVLKNFRFTTFYWAVKPLLLRNRPDQFHYLNVAVAKGTEETVLADTKAAWHELRPYTPFAGQWYDDFLRERHTHADDNNFMALLIALCFSIACLGLLGIVTYDTQTRTKEVGIRKVMGAEVGQVIWLLSRRFVRLLLLAGAIALPLGYLAGYVFLFNFAYHVSIGIETLGLCFGVLLLLGGLTIVIQTYRAAIANPVNSIRTE